MRPLHTLCTHIEWGGGQYSFGKILGVRWTIQRGRYSGQIEKIFPGEKSHMSHFIFNCSQESSLSLSELSEELETFYASNGKTYTVESDAPPRKGVEIPESENTIGSIISTYMTSENIDDFFSMTEFSNVYNNWILHKLLSLKENFGTNESTTIEITRIWSNKMLQGSRGLIHEHSSEYPYSCNCIFYVTVPENSASYVLHDNEGNVTESISVKTGDLIVHDSDLKHSITEHNSAEPRRAIVMDYRYV